EEINYQSRLRCMSEETGRFSILWRNGFKQFGGIVLNLLENGHKGQLYVRILQVRILTLILFYTFTSGMKNFATLKEEERKWRRSPTT
ncbi:hypothetical protein VIGAN_07048400, partial [Vigna angularis var. angularis]